MNASSSHRGAGSADPGVGAEPAPGIPDHELIRRIGKGGYGEVWLARNVMGTLRAVKVVYRNAFADPRPYEREFAGIQRFEPISRSHPGLVHVLQIGRNEPAGFFYYVMELGDGDGDGPDGVPPAGPGPGERMLPEYRPRTLASDLRRCGRLPFAECLRVALALVEALDHLHRVGLVHRDVKPSNIIFVNGVPKLADIGLVAERGEASLVGTEGFIAPEGQGQPPADLFSLGKVLYEISTGKDRQHFPEPLTTLAELPDHMDWMEFNEIVARACEPDIRRRYASAAEMRTDLVLLSGGKSVRRLRRIERNWRRALFGAGVAAGLVIVGWIVRAGVEGRARGAYVDHLWKAQMLQNTRHHLGWRSNALALVRSAAAIRRGREANDQAAAVLVGLDARLVLVTNHAVHSVAFSGDGGRLLAGGGDDRHAFEVVPGQKRVASAGIPSAGWVAVGPDGRAWHYGTNQFGQWCRRDWETGKEGPPLERSEGLGKPGSRSLMAAVSSDGRYFAGVVQGATEHGGLKIWDGESGGQVASLPPLATALAFAPDSSLLAVGEVDGQVRVWSVEEAREVLTVGGGQRARANAVRSLAFSRKTTRPAPLSPGQWILAVGDSAGGVTLWDLATRLPVRFMSGPQLEVSALCFNGDGTLLASGGRGSPMIWDTATGRHLLTLGPADVATSLSFSRDGRYLAAGSARRFTPGVVAIWELEDGRGIRRLRGGGAPVTYLAVDPAGAVLAAMAHDWRVGVWDLSNGVRVAELAVPEGLSADNAALAFRSDGRQLAIAAGESAQWWDLPAWTPSPIVPLPRGLGDRLAYRPSGELILFRQEVLRGVPVDRSEWWAPASIDPRVFRVRNLFDLTSTRTMTEFNGRLRSAVMTADGQRVVVEAPFQSGTNLHRRLAAIDLDTGTEIWSKRLAKTIDWSVLVLDSTGKWLAAELTNSPGTFLIDAGSGKELSWYSQPVRAMHGPGDLRLEQWTDSLDPATGWTLFVGGRPEPVVTFAVGVGVSQFPVFFDGGRMLAWGLEDGTVMVVDLPRVRRELAAVGLGW